MTHRSEEIGVESPQAHVPRPVVAIVGRPNVGKSTLFNRIVGKRLAIVEDVPGVTRDRHYADADWEGRPFTVVDTGGFLPETEDALMQRVRDQARLAMDEAQSVIFVTDGVAGVTASDQEIAGLLRKGGKPTFLAVNKIDSTRREENESFFDFFRLGFQKTFAVSAEHGRGLSELMDALVESFPPAPLAEKMDEELCRVAIVGRPNVGKSTLINKLLGEERFIASEVPGTTRDPIDARLIHQGRTYVLTDTAGLRRKSSIAAQVEQFSVVRALSAIDRADVVVLLLDAGELAVEQDARIASIALEKGKGLVLMVNKWDQVEGKAKAAELREELAIRLPFLSWAPAIYGSALTGNQVFKVLETAGELYEHQVARIPTPQLNEFLHKIVDEHPAPLAPGGRPVRLFYIAQVGTRPPAFTIACNRPDAVGEDYKRFIVNRMRASFGLRVPIRLLMRAKSKRAFVRHGEK
jgi:GTP-binding protein